MLINACNFYSIHIPLLNCVNYQSGFQIKPFLWQLVSELVGKGVLDSERAGRCKAEAFPLFKFQIWSTQLTLNGWSEAILEWYLLKSTFLISPTNNCKIYGNAGIHWLDVQQAANLHHDYYTCIIITESYLTTTKVLCYLILL